MSKRSGPLDHIRQNDTIELLTLANGAWIYQGNTLPLDEDFHMVKAQIRACMINHTAGEVPLLIAMASGDLTVAEIAEAWAANGPSNRSDRIPKERAERPLWILTQFGSFTDELLLNEHGGPVLDFPPKGMKGWTFSNDTGWGLVVGNNSGAGLTTGTIIRFTADYFGRWLS